MIGCVPRDFISSGFVFVICLVFKTSKFLFDNFHIKSKMFMLQSIQYLKAEFTGMWCKREIIFVNNKLYDYN